MFVNGVDHDADRNPLSTEIETGTDVVHVQVLGDAHRARKNWNSTNVVVRVLKNKPYYNCYKACQHM